jgi:erythronate-4-phosphate dehydrogenase
MNILADSNIPFLCETLSNYGHVRYKEGKSISQRDIADVEVLLVRTRTKCNEELLKNSPVKFIGTATIGTDHIDMDYCRQHAITVANAAGSNAPAVMQYVTTALLNLAIVKDIPLSAMTLGVIGVGNVGKMIVNTALALGMNVLQNDPPRAAKEGAQNFTELHEVLKNSDIVTLHLPLDNSTRGFAGENFFKNIKQGAWLINTSRGEIINECELIKYRSKLGALVLDVWKNEPEINTELLKLTDIATPHIAGYSCQGKRKASEMVLAALAHWLNAPYPILHSDPEHNRSNEIRLSHDQEIQDKLFLAVQKTFPIFDEDNLLRMQPCHFEKIRNEYIFRDDFSAYTVQLSPEDKETATILKQLDFNVKLVNSNI